MMHCRMDNDHDRWIAMLRSQNNNGVSSVAMREGDHHQSGEEIVGWDHARVEADEDEEDQHGQAAEWSQVVRVLRVSVTVCLCGGKKTCCCSRFIVRSHADWRHRKVDEYFLLIARNSLRPALHAAEKGGIPWRSRFSFHRTTSR